MSCCTLSPSSFPQGQQCLVQCLRRGANPPGAPRLPPPCAQGGRKKLTVWGLGRGRGVVQVLSSLAREGESYWGCLREGPWGTRRAQAATSLASPGSVERFTLSLQGPGTRRPCPGYCPCVYVCVIEVGVCNNVLIPPPQLLRAHSPMGVHPQGGPVILAEAVYPRGHGRDQVAMRWGWYVPLCCGARHHASTVGKVKLLKVLV